jgi:hypothetical protein
MATPIVDVKCEYQYYWYTNPDGSRMKIPVGFFVKIQLDGTTTWITTPIEAVEVPAPTV